MAIIYICIFLLGASFASFLNASIYRIEEGIKYPDIVKNGSYCEKCKKKLSWWELIPILGYILLKGKCNNCRTKINISYPISETLLGLSFLLFYLNNISWYFWVILISLFVLSSYDIKYKGIPKSITHVFITFSILIFLFFRLNIINIYLPVGITLFLLLLNLIKRSFGLGDILVLFAIGILLNHQQFLVLFWIGIILALLYSTILIIKKKISIKKTKIAMIPFFTVSFVISLLYGEVIFSKVWTFLSLY